MSVQNPVEQESDWRSSSLIRRVHSINARILVVFLALHLTNHLAFLFGPETHLGIMESLRSVYRAPVIEPILYGLFVVQILAGLWLAKRNWRPNSGWAWAQVISGLVIVFFAVQHLSATLLVRSGYDLIDTNAWWALSVVSTPLLAAYFVPYYTAGVAAVCIHIASALHFRGYQSARKLAFAGIALAVLIVGSMAVQSQLTPLPPAYQDYLTEMFGS